MPKCRYCGKEFVKGILSFCSKECAESHKKKWFLPKFFIILFTFERTVNPEKAILLTFVMKVN